MPDPQAPGHVGPSVQRCLILMALLFFGHALADQMPKPPAVEPVATFERPLLQRDNSMDVVELADGKLLLFGGRAYGSAVSARRSEILDPTTLRFEAAGTLSVERRWSRALRLSDGRVVVAGGAYASFDLNRPDEAVSAPPEVWDPQRRDWSPLAGIEIGAREGVLMAERAGELVFLLIDESPPDARAARALRAFRWRLAEDRAQSLPPPPVTRTGGVVTQLGDGRVLFLGGEAWPDRSLADCGDCAGGFAPVTPAACRVAAALSASLAGLPELGWRRGFGEAFWPPGPSALDCEIAVLPSELLEPWSGRIVQAAAAPPTLVERIHGGIGHPLANGDLLVLTQSRTPPDQPAIVHAARWSPASDRWQLLPGFEIPAFAGWQGSLQEAADGSVIRLRNRWSPGDPAWTPMDRPLPGESRLLKNAAGEVLAVASRAPFIARYDSENHAWAWAQAGYIDGDGTVSLGLPDGRLAVWTVLPLDGGRQIHVQWWDPHTDRWQWRREALPPNPRRLEAALLPTGEALLIAHYDHGRARCQRGNPGNTNGRECGSLGFDSASRRDPTGQNRPVADDVILTTAADGRLLLVQNQAEAQLFDVEANRWRRVALEATGQLLLEGAPVRTPRPYFWFADPASGKPVDASAAVLRQQRGEYGGYRAELLWDPRQQEWAQVSVGQPRLGNDALWLPDGCAIGRVDGRFRLYDPKQGRYGDLGPVPFPAGSLAVLPDGTVTLVASLTAYREREPTFFHRRARCSGFDGGEFMPLPPAKPTPAGPATAVTPAEPATPGRGQAALAWLVAHPVVPLAVLLPALALILLRGLQRRLRDRDRRLQVPAPLAIGIRILFYGGVALLLIAPLLQYLALTDQAPATGIRSADRPCRYVGYWTAQDPEASDGTRWRYFLGDDGELEIWRLDANWVASESVLRGRWHHRDSHLHWQSDSASDSVQTNLILADVGQANGLLLQRPDGSLLRLHFKAPAFSTRACSP